MSKIEVDKVDPQSGTALEIGTSGDTVTVPSGVTLTTTNATVNLPASVGGLGTGITNAQLAGSIDVTTKITGVVPTANLGSGSASSSVFLAGDSTWIAAGGGITVADQWRVTADITSDADPIASNLEQVDTGGQGTLGSAMTESSGVFTFPETGIYLVSMGGRGDCPGSADNVNMSISVTTDDSSYAGIAAGGESAGASSSAKVFGMYCQTLVDVTDTSNVKVRFSVGSIASGNFFSGSTTENSTYMTFIRLGDT